MEHSKINNFQIYPQSIKTHSENYIKAKATLKDAFPKAEQVPFWSLQLLSRNKDVDTFSWHDLNNNYVGMSYSIHHEGKLLILYLALDKIARNKGYGPQIIKYLQQKDSIKDTVLDIESPYQSCKNIDQRIRRLNFYKRLGFYSTESEIIEPECSYLILGTSINPITNIEIYKDLTARMSLNLCHLKIIPVQKDK